MKALMAKYPDIKGAGRRDAGGGRGQRLRRACMLAALAIASAGSHRRRRRSARASTRSTSYDGLIKTYNKPFSRDSARRAQRERLRLGAVHRQPHPAGRHEEVAPNVQNGRQAAVLLCCHSALISGLGLGSMYGLMALGFYVTYAVSGTVNFAQGSSMMLGAVLRLRLRADAGLADAAGRRAGARAVRALRRCWSSCVAVRPFVRPRLQRLADGDRGAGHRARQRGAVHLRQGAAQPAVAAGAGAASSSAASAWASIRCRLLIPVRRAWRSPALLHLLCAPHALGQGDAGRGAEPRRRAPDGHHRSGAWSAPRSRCRRCSRASPAC